MMLNSIPQRWMLILLACLFHGRLAAHEGHGHRAPTYEVTTASDVPAQESRLILSIVDAHSGKPLAARFSLQIDGQDYVPPFLGRHGLRFESIHQGKKQRFTVTYARGSGSVEIPIPTAARRGSITVAKGFEFRPEVARFDLEGQRAEVTIALRRWNDLETQGWVAADEHLHYERLDPRHDRDWFTMLDADGLGYGHFMVLKGGNLPGVWAEQYAYGRAGEGTDGVRSLRPGEEYRDGSQGHINLLGLSAVIEPISTGGIGGRDQPYNYPPLLDVFDKSRALGGLGGPAHGATLSRSPTAILDTILGGVDFYEIANTHLYEREAWYRVMNCGYFLPPAAGTDLPNFPFRDDWQPFLGEVRMYVRVGDERGFDAWKQGVQRGEVFITSGPLVSLTINGVGPGGTVLLPEGEGEVDVQAELASPQPLESFELVRNGEPVTTQVDRDNADGIHRLRIQAPTRIDRSCWLAVRGTGAKKGALERHTKFAQTTIAHTAGIQVLVGEQPIASRASVEVLRRQLEHQREFYRSDARFERDEHRQRFVGLFDEALRKLASRPTQ